jgi:hypothetical protein
MPSERTPKHPKKPRTARSAGAARPKGRRVVVQGLLGIGLDNDDGHTRITKGEDFFLVGGSAETHEKMQEFTIRLTERLGKKGKRIRDAAITELRDIAGELSD